MSPPARRVARLFFYGLGRVLDWSRGHVYMGVLRAYGRTLCAAHTLLLLLPPALRSTGAVPFGGAGSARPESM